MDINEPCRVSIEERNRDYPDQSVSSIFDASPVVAEPDAARDEARRKNIATYKQKQNSIVEAKRKLAAELKIAEQIGAVK